MVNQQATEAELGWLAGILDGEGWIGFSIAKDSRAKTRRQVVVKTEVRVNNTDKAIIDKLVVIFNKLGVNPYVRTTKQRGVSREIHEAATKNMTGVERILKEVLSYLVGNKKERSQLMLKFIELRLGDAGKSINPAYSSLGNYNGPRFLVRPYTDEELELVEKCRKLQAPGASETTRKSRDQKVLEMKTLNSEYRELLDKI